MISLIKDKSVKEFGDFQTPRELTFKVCQLLSSLNVQPKTIIEPNCGIGNFILSSKNIFYSANIFGFDISSKYIELTQNKFRNSENIVIELANFFNKDWKAFLKDLPKPILILGNPPWVTNSQLSILESHNTPKKENFQSFSGLEAKTGKSNFDISEWMLINLFESLNKQDAHLAMICKTSVARKTLKYAWKSNINLLYSSIYRIETEKYFNASVDSCLLVCQFSKTETDKTAKIFNNLSSEYPSQEIGYRNNELVASIPYYEKWNYLNGGAEIKWRSGIKHDCSKVMELRKNGDKYENGFGELIDIEDEFVYPLLKSSDLANRNLDPRRWVLITQKKIKENTSKISLTAPKTWNYLTSKAGLLDNRKSSIYQNSPKFSIFGVGNYSFSPWKIAISGFYKKLNFNVIGSYNNKPIILDDTCYFISFNNKEEAIKICDLLNSEIGKEFYESFIFWDSKRPITVDILQKLNISKLEKFNNLKVENGIEEAIKIMKSSFIIQSAQPSFEFE